MKREFVKHDEGRRDFFRSAGRYGLLGLLGLAAALTGRRSLSNQRCTNQGLCSSCAVFNGCALPQALSAKQFKNGGNL